MLKLYSTEDEKLIIQSFDHQFFQNKIVYGKKAYQIDTRLDIIEQVKYLLDCLEILERAKSIPTVAELLKTFSFHQKLRRLVADYVYYKENDNYLGEQQIREEICKLIKGHEIDICLLIQEINYLRPSHKKEISYSSTVGVGVDNITKYELDDLAPSRDMEAKELGTETEEDFSDLVEEADANAVSG